RSLGHSRRPRRLEAACVLDPPAPETWIGRPDCCVVPLELPPDDPCWFCRYLAGTAPYTILERDDTTATLVTFEQRGQGHVLVVPIRHVKTVIELAPHEQWAVMDAVARSTRSIL